MLEARFRRRVGSLTAATFASAGHAMQNGHRIVTRRVPRPWRPASVPPCRQAREPNAARDRTRIEGASPVNYTAYYRFGVTPWERYARAAASSIERMLDHEQDRRGGPLGRALDLGCGRGVFSAELARRGWQVVGLDFVPKAIEAAKAQAIEGATFVVGDVTELDSGELGEFDLLLDIGCFQGLDAEQRRQYGRGVASLAASDASLLMLEFGATRLRSWIGGVHETEVREALPGWDLETVTPAPTEGLGWPMNRTSPQWYRFTRSR